MNCYYRQPLAQSFVLQAKQIADRLPATVDDATRSRIHEQLITEILQRGREAQEQLFQQSTAGTKTDD